MSILDAARNHDVVAGCVGALPSESAVEDSGGLAISERPSPATSFDIESTIGTPAAQRNGIEYPDVPLIADTTVVYPYNRRMSELAGCVTAPEEVAVGIADDAVEIRSRGWRTLAALHGQIETDSSGPSSANTDFPSWSTPCWMR